jgi:methyltransferase
MVTSVELYLLFLLLLSLERVGELLLSRRNAARAFARGAVEVGQRHFRVMAGLHTLFLIACAAEVVGLHRQFPGALGFAALGGALLAQGLRYWAIATLGERWNTRVIVLPEAAPVTGGPYRFVRHPNYVAVVAELVLVPLIHGAWITAIVFTVANAVLLAVRIRVEEEALGAAWKQHFAHAPRFIPGGTRA